MEEAGQDPRPDTRPLIASPLIASEIKSGLAEITPQDNWTQRAAARLYVGTCALFGCRTLSVVAIEVPFMVATFIPLVVVGSLAMIAVPISVKIALSIVMRRHPV